jgi:hypothetical protein
MNKNGFANSLLLILVAIIIIVGVGFYFYSQANTSVLSSAIRIQPQDVASQAAEVSVTQALTLIQQCHVGEFDINIVGNSVLNADIILKNNQKIALSGASVSDAASLETAIHKAMATCGTIVISGTVSSGGEISPSGAHSPSPTPSTLPPSCTFSAYPSSRIVAGNPVELRWTCQNTNACSIESDHGDTYPNQNPAQGTLEVTPRYAVINYTLNCNGINGVMVSKVVTVTVAPQSNATPAYP